MRSSTSPYTPRDAFLVPGLVSLCRLPLAAAFPFALHDGRWAAAVLAAAASTDMLDGFLARTRHEQTPTGAVLDALADKVFVLTVVISMAATGRLSALDLALLAVRDIGELPLVAGLGAAGRLTTGGERRSNALGKLTTVCQFVALGSSLLGFAHSRVFFVLTGVSGAMAAASYWVRELVREARA